MVNMMIGMMKTNMIKVTGKDAQEIIKELKNNHTSEEMKQFLKSCRKVSSQIKRR